MDSIAGLLWLKAIHRVAYQKEIQYNDLVALWIAYQITEKHLTITQDDLYKTLPLNSRSCEQKLEIFRKKKWIEWHSGSGFRQRKYWQLTGEALKLMSAIKSVHTHLVRNCEFKPRFKKKGKKTTRNAPDSIANEPPHASV